MADEQEPKKPRKRIVKNDYPIDDNYSIRIDKYAENPEDRATFWSKRWKNAKMTGRVFYRGTKAGGKVITATIRLGVHGCVSVGRMVMMYVMNRRLKKSDRVYHKDGNPLNNYPDNLEIRDKGDITPNRNK